MPWNPHEFAELVTSVVSLITKADFSKKMMTNDNLCGQFNFGHLFLLRSYAGCQWCVGHNNCESPFGLGNTGVLG